MKYTIFLTLKIEMSDLPGMLHMKKLTVKIPVFLQIIRYGIVGILNNLLGYLAYLFTTYFWLDPKIAITIFYPVGAVAAYIGHSKYSFSYQQRMSIYTVMRFILAYVIGYGVNFMILLILSDKLAFPHQIVQGLAIFIVAGVLFLLLKYFVFFPSAHRK